MTSRSTTPASAAPGPTVPDPESVASSVISTSASGAGKSTFWPSTSASFRLSPSLLATTPFHGPRSGWRPLIPESVIASVRSGHPR
jgi:hypothetical protein